MDICGAITDRRVVEFDYDGHHRVVQLAAHGLHRTSGNAVVRGYQVGGTGASRPVPFWDLFLVEKINGFVATEESFGTDPPNYKPGDKHIDVHCEL